LTTVKVSGNDITFKDLTIENNAAPLGQAVALHTEGECSHFVNIGMVVVGDNRIFGAFAYQLNVLDPRGNYQLLFIRVSGNDITFKDLTIENNAAPLGQAVALHTEGDRLMPR